VRRALQQRHASLIALAARHASNPKTVAKWRKRPSVEDAPMGPKTPRSTVLTPEQEAACVAFRKQTLLPLDDCLSALQASIPALTRSSLHRCSRRHGIGRLPEVAGATPAKKVFRTYPIGSFHVDIAEVRTEEGKRYLFVAIDRTAKFAYAEFLPRAGKLAAAQFLRNLVAAVPYAIHTVLTDNGIRCTNRAQDRCDFAHIVDRVCREHGIAHRLTTIAHPGPTVRSRA
jgi:transposase-like protein